MAKFQIRKSPNGEFYYHLRATGNNEIILRGEQYKTKSACMNGTASVRTNSTYDSRYEKLYSANRQYYFNLKAANGEVIGTSENYTTIANRDHGIQLVKQQAPTAPDEDLT